MCFTKPPMCKEEMAARDALNKLWGLAQLDCPGVTHKSFCIEEAWLKLKAIHDLKVKSIVKALKAAEAKNLCDLCKPE